MVARIQLRIGTGCARTLARRHPRRRRFHRRRSVRALQRDAAGDAAAWHSSLAISVNRRFLTSPCNLGPCYPDRRPSVAAMDGKGISMRRSVTLPILLWMTVGTSAQTRLSKASVEDAIALGKNCG